MKKQMKTLQKLPSGGRVTVIEGGIADERKEKLIAAILKQKTYTLESGFVRYMAISLRRLSYHTLANLNLLIGLKINDDRDARTEAARPRKTSAAR